MEPKLKLKKDMLTTEYSLPTGISFWRKIVNKLMTVLVIIAVILAIIPLILILGDVIIKGAPALSIGFLTHLQKPPNVSGGGIANAIVGTFTMVGIAALISVPIGIGAGVFFSEWSSSKISTVSGFMNDVLTGFPSIVLGLFVFVIIVYPTKQFSAFAGGVALSFVMLPIIARTTGESLKLVPTTLREASMALGIPRWKTVLRVVISNGKNGLLTGILLSVARATGETAPILLTASTSIYFAKSIFQPTASLTVLIYNYATSPYASWQTQAWGAALVLILIMLGLNLLVKLTIGRNVAGKRMDI
ncbi:MAG TPA: phosphate ABC transporter permease PstA [Candidatus Acidoferrum sp.]|nr:phosphate ABC transporter permease PstA [Candidatus Acidoferrum sp.]